VHAAERLLLALAATGLLATGCAPKELERRIAVLEQSQAKLAQETAAATQKVQKLETLAADVDAVKAYFKEVSDKVRAMRDDIMRLLDEQSMRVDEGRQAYLRVLRIQEKTLQALLPMLDKAIKALEKKLPEARKAVAPPPAPPVLGTTPAATPSAPTVPPAP